MFISTTLREIMKRKIAILLLLIMLVSTSGFTLDRHYCNGKLVNIFLLTHFGDCCDSSMPMGENSCADHAISYCTVGQVEFIPATIHIVKIVIPLDGISTASFYRFNHAKNDNLIVLNSPYSKDNIKIYLRNESFLN
jgi:hypothetical protein